MRRWYVSIKYETNESRRLYKLLSSSSSSASFSSSIVLDLIGSKSGRRTADGSVKMNAGDADRQIKQMVNFILQEAHEKANEIRIKVKEKKQKSCRVEVGEGLGAKR